MKILKIANQNYMVQGNGVDQVYEIVVHMLSLPPTEARQDDVGFQYGHYQYVSGLPIGRSMDVKTLSSLIHVLGTYKNTQIPALGFNFTEVRRNVIKNIKESNPNPNVGDLDEDSNKVKATGTDQYGKTLLYIPGGVDRSMTIAINRAVRKCLEENGVQQEMNNYSGKMKAKRPMSASNLGRAGRNAGQDQFIGPTLTAQNSKMPTEVSHIDIKRMKPKRINQEKEKLVRSLSRFLKTCVVKLKLRLSLYVSA